VRELNSGHVAELFLSVVSYSNGSDAVLDDDVLVILAVSNLHDGCWIFAPKVGTMPYRGRKDTASKQLEVGLSTLSRSSVSPRDYKFGTAIPPWIAKRRGLGPQQRRSLEPRS
jgi:hypothetical protein